MISTDRLIFQAGSAVRARQIAQARQWQEVHIIVFARQNAHVPREQAISPNCFVYSTHSRSRFLYALDAIRLGRFIISQRGIHEITCQDTSLTAMAGVSLKKEFHLPLELQMHEDMGSPNYGYSWSNKVRGFMARRYIPEADHVRVVSERIKHFLTGRLGIDANKIEVRPIAVDTAAITNAAVTVDLHAKYPQYDKIVLMAGRLEREKNFGLAIEAWPEVIHGHPKAGLVIVGKGSQESDLRRRADALGISASVVFESWADQATLASYYKTCDAFLNTSLFEGYGMTFKEARAAGADIISTDVGIAREVGAAIVDWTPSDVARGLKSILGV